MSDATGATPAESVRFTVVTAAYNAEGTIARTLDSLLAQDFADWTAVVVDDGSTDGTRAIADAYRARDARIFVLSQVNAGAGAARNAAIAASSSDYVVVLDADDELLPAHLSTMSKFIDAHPGFDIYSCNQWVLWPDGERRIYVDDPECRPFVTMDLAGLISGQRYLAVGGSIIRRGLIDEIGGFNPFVYCEDVEFWRRAFAHRARHIFCPEPLVYYHRDVAGQKTADQRRILGSVVEIDTALRASGLLTPAELEVLDQRLAFFHKRLAEEKARAGDTAGLLEVFRGARGAYPSAIKYRVALVAGAIDARLLAWLLRRGR